MAKLDHFIEKMVLKTLQGKFFNKLLTQQLKL